MAPAALEFKYGIKHKHVSVIIRLCIAMFFAVLTANCGGGSSSTGTNPPVTPDTRPVIGIMSPSSALVGREAFILTVNGRNFVSGAKVLWNSAERPTTFLSSTQLRADITSGDVTRAGVSKIVVANPAPKIEYSIEANFPINNPVPTLYSANPMNITAGSASATLVLNGMNFVSDSIVQFGDSDRTCTFTNSTRISIDLTSADLASMRSVPIYVKNPAPGGGTSSSGITLTITSSDLSVLTQSLPPAVSGRQYRYTLQAEGGTSSYSWALASGALPTGLSLSTSGEIEGTAPDVDVDTSFGFTARVTDRQLPLMATQELIIIARHDNLGRNDVCGPDTASPISNGVIRASISPYGDVDVYSFQASAGASISAEIRAQRLSLYGDPTSKDIFLDSFLEILNSSCVRIAYNDDIELGIIQDSSISSLSLTTAGVYYIRVSDLRGDGRPDFIYELQLSGAQ